MRKRRKKRVSLAPSHGFDGRMIVADAVVEDPDRNDPGNRIKVRRNVFAPVEQLVAKGRLDAAGAAACRKYLDLYVRASIGGARAIDYGKVRVSGGRVADPLSEAALAAGMGLARLSYVPGVGPMGAALLRMIVGEEMTIAAVARSLYGGTDRTRAEHHVRERFLEAVAALVDEWGIVAAGPVRARMRHAHETVTGPEPEWTVGKFRDLVEVKR